MSLPPEKMCRFMLFKMMLPALQGLLYLYADDLQLNKSAMTCALTNMHLFLFEDARIKNIRDHLEVVLHTHTRT